METVLSRATAADLRAEPFPHLVIRGAVEPALCRQLLQEYPPLEAVARRPRWRSNQRFSLGCQEALQAPQVGALWRQFLAAHVSQAFLDSLLALFATAIRARYPAFEREHGPLDRLRAGLRHRDDPAAAALLLDAQVCVNTPVQRQPSSVRRGHLDNPDKLFAGLFYLRQPQDDSRGGHLELYRYRDGRQHFHGQFIEDEHIECVQTVRYESNTLVLMLNTPDSLHGVTRRGPGAQPRCLMNLLGVVRRPLFDLGALQAPPVGRRWWEPRLRLAGQRG